MAHFNFVISQNARWGHAGFYIDCHRMTVPENILLQKKHWHDTTRDDILTCARKPTLVSSIYLTEPTTKKCKTEKKLKSKNGYAQK